MVRLSTKMVAVFISLTTSIAYADAKKILHIFGSEAIEGSDGMYSPKSATVFYNNETVDSLTLWQNGKVTKATSTYSMKTSSLVEIGKEIYRTNCENFEGASSEVKILSVEMTDSSLISKVEWEGQKLNDETPRVDKSFLKDFLDIPEGCPPLEEFTEDTNSTEDYILPRTLVKKGSLLDTAYVVTEMAINNDRMLMHVKVSPSVSATYDVDRETGKNHLYNGDSYENIDLLEDGRSVTILDYHSPRSYENVKNSSREDSTKVDIKIGDKKHTYDLKNDYLITSSTYDHKTGQVHFLGSLSTGELSKRGKYLLTLDLDTAEVKPTFFKGVGKNGQANIAVLPNNTVAVFAEWIKGGAPRGNNIIELYTKDGERLESLVLDDFSVIYDIYVRENDIIYISGIDNRGNGQVLYYHQH
ncbi:MAG: hypothetical protein KDD40_06085 [Bdellovibrionales bacterium]|nr:hypothetical protein [Bdellovibrionales bacterium]